MSLQDDPAALADHMLDLSFDAPVAKREIEAALGAGDTDLAASFLDLARDRNVAVDPGLADRVEAAKVAAASAGHAVGSFAQGLVTGEPADMAGLAGTAVGDLFVFGDIRDAVREGTRLATGQPADELILGLAGVGIAITAGTYATVGVGAPVRLGLSIAKAARATGRMSAHMAEWVGRSLREVLDWGALGRAIGGAGVTGPVVAVRAAREAVKVEKTAALFRLAGDVGRVQAKAGTQAALDGLKLAEGPQGHVAHRQARREIRRQDPRRPQARRPRRDPADRQRVQPVLLDAGRGHDPVRLLLLLQAHRRARDRALDRPPQGAHRAPAIGVRRRRAAA